MKKMLLFLSLIAIALLITAWRASSKKVPGDDVLVLGYTSKTLNAKVNGSPLKRVNPYFTVIPYDYYQVTHTARTEVAELIKKLQNVNNLNTLVKKAGNYFKNRPYNAEGAEGEGDWCTLTQRGCAHIQQDPLYRTDQFDCQTWVQTALALINARNINDYEKNILAIEYGAAHTDSIRYYNRNNFISSDFNPVNQASGLLKDVTNKGVFSSYARKTNALINRQKWFAYQAKPNLIGENVRVIRNADGLVMYHRLKNKYPAPFHVFSPETVTIAYVPKETFVKKSVDSKGTVRYQPNLKLINQIPTPSVIEIVRDVKQWTMNEKNIKDVIGSELNVSHLGLLYRDRFPYGSTIFQKITCSKDKAGNKVCSVTPQICRKKTGCIETLFLHATEAYPDGYYYQDAQGHYQCTAKKPAGGTPYTTCNRLLALPLGDYLFNYQYDHYVYLENPAILGINIEKILN
ncbi:N-acetylmuramoyl-L-alanine amidase-like domain-containing protein [Coxiella burnetii]|uniref:N-acetylmuramoyl-L-alanine amidase-like domain-containing protein n=1 Tax=Coxiella burnetii TaxID=777 RepID=UPI000CCBDE51|nr:N-acetylmuramoyl-L-alanine amidase-like domain-containing protein [Coxiella burnetii]PNT89218.1 DUF1460 domain-containing protein [Coxiella burnetii]